ncbi:hypothetical protein [Haloarcula argentinensis]|uniref:Uncharacterized protein n=1 Tax=Haloarcula argentinensis TaxID=43776 RepID=A0A847UQK6_HALAR|nr:hypothetical protein [Haloarcula argentinensis]
MTIATNGKVERINVVQDDDGQDQAPSNEKRQKQIQHALGNPTGATIRTYTTGGTAVEQLPDLSIPDGVTALVVYLPANSGDVFLGDADDQFIPLTDAGHVFEWEGATTAALHIRTNTAGDGVGIIFEGAQ